VVAWAQSCPLSYEGVFLEIRELHDRKEVLNEATEEVEQFAGDQILFMRKQLSEEGKLKTDEDGTMWIKVEEEQGVKEIVADAEKRETKNEENYYSVIVVNTLLDLGILFKFDYFLKKFSNNLLLTIEFEKFLKIHFVRAEFYF